MPLLNAPLTTSGAQILDASGQPVRLAGVNWGGAYSDEVVPGGLDQLHRDVIADRIVNMGFNHVRFPFSVGTFLGNGGGQRGGTVPDPALLAANPDLAGASPWQVWTECVAALTSAGLGVIPNQHMLYPGFCCSAADNNGLWYNGSWPAAVFQACWAQVAREFAGNPLVIGYDIHNEPRPAQSASGLITPTWGDGNPATDIRLMYHDTIVNTLQPASPGKLWFCEGLSYAGDLTKAGAHPVGVPGTVYSMHDYSWFHAAGQTQAGYFAAMDAAGGYLLQNSQAPLWVGEFGIDTGTAANMTSPWMTDFLAWAAARRVHWCWWRLDAIWQKATEPVTNVLKAHQGDRESFGLMQGQDWLGDQVAVLRALQAIM